MATLRLPHRKNLGLVDPLAYDAKKRATSPRILIALCDSLSQVMIAAKFGLSSAIGKDFGRSAVVRPATFKAPDVFEFLGEIPSCAKRRGVAAHTLRRKSLSYGGDYWI